MESGAESGQEWVFYDVGGTRPQRAVWAPFFDNGQSLDLLPTRNCNKSRFCTVTAIIFLAPLSAFNERLTEDPSVNRLVCFPIDFCVALIDLTSTIQEDTYQLWKTICSNKLLASVQFILFMNKFDILVSKLRSGVRFNRYVTKYKTDDGPLDIPEKVAKCMFL